MPMSTIVTKIICTICGYIGTLLILNQHNIGVYDFNGNEGSKWLCLHGESFASFLF